MGRLIMKKLGKKNYDSINSIEYYQCQCSGCSCSNCHCLDACDSKCSIVPYYLYDNGMAEEWVADLQLSEAGVFADDEDGGIA